MKVIGGGKIHFYEAVDECPHQPGPEELWQESCAFYFWDPESNVYAFLRASQVPNRRRGQTTVMLNVWTPDHMYKFSDDEIPLGPNDVTTNSITARNGLCSYSFIGNGQHRWVLEDDDISLNLLMQDDHQGISFFPETAGFLVENAAKNHIEAQGNVSGNIRLRGKEYKVSGHGWRDHSWGPRNWLGFRAHRAYPALFGKDLNIFCMTFVGADGKLTKVGTITRGDTVQFTTDFEVVAYMGSDGLSNVGGQVTLSLDGETKVIDYKPIGKASTTVIHSFAITDTLCHVHMDGRVGVGFSETSHHAQGGSERPFVFESSSGVLDNGIYCR